MDWNEICVEFFNFPKTIIFHLKCMIQIQFWEEGKTTRHIAFYLTNWWSKARRLEINIDLWNRSSGKLWTRAVHQKKDTQNRLCKLVFRRKKIASFWRTVGKIYTPIISFFLKRFVNIAFLELRLLSNERSGNFTFYRPWGIHEFLDSTILKKKITVF